MNARILVFTIFAGLALFLASCSDDDDQDIPGIQPTEQVLKAFKAKYPTAKDTEWKVTNDYFVVDFDVDSTSIVAWYTGNAVWMMEESSLRVTLIPEEIINALQESAYSSWTIDEAYIVNRLGMGMVYKLDVQKGSQENYQYFSQYGNLIKIIYADDSDDEPVVIPSAVASLMELTFNGATLLDIINNDQGVQLFMLDNTIFKIAQLNKNYEWLNTTWEISSEDVPAVVMTGFDASQYGNDQVNSIYTYIDAKGTFYRFNVIHNSQEVTVMFDVTGNMVQ